MEIRRSQIPWNLRISKIDVSIMERKIQRYCPYFKPGDLKRKRLEHQENH